MAVPFDLIMKVRRVERLETGLVIINLEDFEVNFRQVLDEYFNASKHWKHSHKIRGRWENTYAPINKVPTARCILSLAAKKASKHFHKQLICGHGILKNSFWFNHMHHGDETGWHDHKAKAHASGVCYLQVGEDSGKFLYRLPQGEIRNIVPETGMMLLFNSSLSHSVEPSKSRKERISLAFNLFTLPLEMEDDDPFGGHIL